MFQRKHIRIAEAVLCAVLLISLSGCAAGEFFATLGFDTHDYDGEKVINEYENDSAKAEELSEMLKILTVNSPELREFDGTSEAEEKCRDSVLNFMYNANYAKYAGNIELMNEVAEIYPQMRFSVIIPSEDFENTFYKYFGGKEKVDNKSGEMFKYLPQAEVYTTAAQPQKNEVETEIISLTETANTYRLTFRTSLEGDGGEYFALIVKRSDGSSYFRRIEKVG